jgi:hypothetical protein
VPFHVGAACKLLLYPSSMQQLQPKRHTLIINSCAFFACVSLPFFEFQEITFVCLLSASSHAGFWWIKDCAGMLESVHFTGFLQNWNTKLLANLLGHAGHLHEAENVMKAMPCKPNVAVWMALLSTCKIHGNVQMGEHIAKQVLEL